MAKITDGSTKLWDVPSEVANHLEHQTAIFVCDDCSQPGALVYHMAPFQNIEWEGSFQVLIELASAEIYLRDGKTTEALLHLEGAQRILGEGFNPDTLANAAFDSQTGERGR